MVADNRTGSFALTRYRLGTMLLWVGLLAWVPFIVLQVEGYHPSLLWFLPFHLLGVVGGSRMRAAARRELGVVPQNKSRLHRVGKVLIAVGILAWLPYIYVKLVAHSPVEVARFLPYHLSGVLGGLTLLIFDYLVNRGKTQGTTRTTEYK